MNSLEQLPIPIMGHVLDQLNKVTGSKGIVNNADISVLMRYTCNLACTSKGLADQVSHPNVTQIFLQSLSDKYDQSPEHFAALLNTIGARKWLWEYINREGDAHVYQVIQEIYALAASVLIEAKNAGLVFEYSEGREGWPSPNPFYYQTKQGFVLYNDRAPSHIATPLGEIKLYGGGASRGRSPLSVSEIFIKRLNALFVSVACEGYFSQDKGTIYEIVASGSDTIRKISQDEMKEISNEEAKAKNGTQNLIVNSLCGNCSSYNIREVNGKKVPEVVWYEKEKSGRSYEVIKMIWAMLEANSLGLDPVAKPIKHKEVRPSDIAEEPLLKNITEACEWGVELVAKLQKQPIFPGKTWLSCKTKLLVLESYRDAYALEQLNSAAKQFLAKDSEWHIHTFGCGNNTRSLNGKDLGDGLELWIYDKHTPCDLDTLKMAYDSAIKSIGQNWTKSELKDHPAIFFTKSEEDYVLFIKKDNLLSQEYGLINNLACLLGLSESISCCNDWKDKTSSGTYLWIKKDNLEKSLKAFNIES